MLIASVAAAAALLVILVVELGRPGSPSHQVVTQGSTGGKPAVSSTTSALATVELGAGDSGRTISVSRGSLIDVNLSGSEAWPNQPTSSDPAVVRSAGGSSTSTTSHARFAAAAPGTARLIASGLPLCAVQPTPGQMCSQLAMEWTVTVTVT